jgi:hypothetical protein
MKWNHLQQSQDSSVGIVTLRAERSDDQFSIPDGAGNFSFRHRVQNVSGAHPPSYPMGTRGSFPGSKAALAWSWLLASI